MVLVFHFTTSFGGCLQAVFRTWSNICMWDVFAEIVNSFRFSTVFEKKFPSQMFDWLENRSLAEGLKYLSYSYSKSINQVEKILSRKICVTSFLKKAKGCGGTVNRTSVYAEAATRRVLLRCHEKFRRIHKKFSVSKFLFLKSKTL